MLNILSISQTTHKKIQDCKAVNDGEESDYSDVKIKLYIISIKIKHNTVIKVGTDWTNIKNDKGCVA